MKMKFYGGYIVNGTSLEYPATLIFNLSNMMSRSVSLFCAPALTLSPPEVISHFPPPPIQEGK